MPTPDYAYQAHVQVACSGDEQGPAQGVGPVGKFSSKSRTRLAYAVKDVSAWASRFARGTEAGIADQVGFQVVLEEPSRDQVAEAVAEAIERLDFYFEEHSGGSLNFVFSGHGAANGDLLLRDQALSIDELMDWCAAGRAGERRRMRHLRLVLDSCYSGAALARMILHPAHGDRVVLRDALAACLPNQEAFELPRLKHSVLTHTRLRPYADALPDPGWTAHDLTEYRRAERESTQYLTNGRQHALDLVNGHFVCIARNSEKGIEVEERMQLQELQEARDGLPQVRRGS